MNVQSKPAAEDVVALVAELGRRAKAAAASLRNASTTAKNAALLEDARTFLSLMVRDDIRITPAGEWLLDNYHLIEEQVQRIHRTAGGSDKAVNRPAGGPVGNLLDRIVDRAHHLPVRRRDHFGAQQQFIHAQRFALDQAA